MTSIIDLQPEAKCDSELFEKQTGYEHVSVRGGQARDAGAPVTEHTHTICRRGQCGSEEEFQLIPCCGEKLRKPAHCAKHLSDAHLRLHLVVGPFFNNTRLPNA